MYYGDSCDTILSDPICNTCDPNLELGGIGEVAFVKNSYYATLLAGIANPTVWQYGINHGLIKIMPMVRGTFDGGTAKYGPGYGRRVQTFLGSEFKGKIYDPNYVDNAAFWADLLNAYNWNIAIKTDTQVHLSVNEISVSIGNPIDEDTQKNVEWVLDYTFKQKTLFLPHTAPAGIFNCAWANV